MPICKRINGDYHVDGDLAFAPKELQFTSFGDANPLLEANYCSGLESAVIESRKFLKDFCFRHRLRNLRVVGPWPVLRALGDSLWMDPVHMKEQGYLTVASLVREAAGELAAKPEHAGQNSVKRKRDNDPPPSGWESRKQWPAPSQSSFLQPRGRRRY